MRSLKVRALLAAAMLLSVGAACDKMDSKGLPDTGFGDDITLTDGGGDTGVDATTDGDATDGDATDGDATDGDATVDDATDATGDATDTVDADMGDTTQPEVVTTDPATGAGSVAADTAVVITFSEPMDTAAGTLSFADGTTVAVADGSWSADGTTFTWMPATPFAPAQDVTYTINTDFTDEAGNALLRSVRISFMVTDDRTPEVVSTTPTEGATGLSPNGVTPIVIEFNVPVSATSNVALAGGPGTLGTPVFSGTTLTVPVTGLDYDTAYTLDLTGVVDADGTALDPMPVVVDGILDFSTGADTDAPVAVASSPMEGQVDLDRDVGVISVRFDEPMDTATTSFSLTGGTAAIALTGTWTVAGDEVFFDLGQQLEYDTSYSLDLSSLTDANGTALDGTPYLIDGALDFTVSADVFAPAVVSSTPVEGATDLGLTAVASISIVFSESMDVSVTTVPWSTSVATGMFTGTWDANGTTFTVDTSAQVFTGSTYSLDLTGFQDLGGNAISATDAYTGDGVLDFSFIQPTGEDCSAPLGIAGATFDAATGTYTWDLAAGSVSNVDGGGTCDTTPSADAVIVFEKTTPSAANGGDLLQVSATTTDGDPDLNLEIGSGACDVDDTAFVSEACLTDVTDPIIIADLEPGIYYIYVSDWFSSDPFPGATVEITTFSPAKGETCGDPLTAADAMPDGMGQVWTVAAGAHIANDGGALSCDNTPGVDTVIEVVKTSPSPTDDPVNGRYLNIQANSTDTLNVDVRSGACTGASSVVERCLNEVASSDFLLDVPAGTYYVYVGTNASGLSPEFTLRTEEVAMGPGPGESCEQPVTTATATVNGNATTWSFTADQFTSYDEVASCDASSGADVVIEYVKTTNSLANGGTSLNVVANESVNVEIFDGVCSDAAQSLACVASGTPNTTVDVGPGTYYIVVSTRTVQTSFPAVDVTVNESNEQPVPGESCQAPLTTADAQQNATGAWTWSFREGQFVDTDGAFSCDTSPGGDGVIEYVKTTPSVTADPVNGRYLSVFGTTRDAFDDIVLAVSTDSCAITAASETSCESASPSGSSVLDVGPGTYYIWIASTSGTFHPGTQVTVAETTNATLPGEDCTNPLTAADAQPSTGTGLLWRLGPEAYTSTDGGGTCDSTPSDDAVIEYVKTTADIANGGSALRVRAFGYDADTLNLEVFDGPTCMLDAASSLVCGTDDDGFEHIVDVPAGTYYIAVSHSLSSSAFPPVDVYVDEVGSTTAPGESCADPLTVADAYVSGETALFQLVEDAYQTNDGGITCDTTPGRDAVIEYVKTSASFTNGGKFLEVEALNVDTTVYLEVLDACDSSVGNSLLCADSESDPYKKRLDVGPGTYYIYVASASDTSTFDAYEVAITETDDPGPAGESCGNPLTVADATSTTAAGFSWTIPDLGVTENQFEFTCDTTPGADLVIEYTKTTPDVAGGGSLLRVNASTDSTTNDLNVQVVSGACGIGAIVEDCQSDRNVIDQYLDLPAGTYYIYVGEENTTDFDETTIVIEEVAAATQPEGESCRAPYTVTSANYTAPAAAGDPHVWVIPDTILGQDVSDGALSCDDVIGADAVVQFTKTTGTSLLEVVINHTTTTGSLAAEVTDTCDQSGTSFACDSGSDDLSFFVGGPAGDRFVWVAEASDFTDYQGATVSIREIEPAPGEACTNPLAGTLNAATSLNLTTTQALDAPSCFGLGNIEWYQVTPSTSLIELSSDALSIAAIDQSNGTEAACSNTPGTPFNRFVTPGQSYCIAVEVAAAAPTATQFTVNEFAYTGVRDNRVPIAIANPNGISLTSDRWMASSNASLFFGLPDEIIEIPKAGGLLVPHGSADGLDSDQIGYDGVVAQNQLFSLDDAANLTRPRIFRVKDAANVWGPTPWEGLVIYENDSRALTYDGTDLIYVEYDSSDDAIFYSVPAADGSAGTVPTVLGRNSDIEYVSGLAVDANWFFVSGEIGTTEGIYRISRATPSMAPELLLEITIEEFTKAAVFYDPVSVTPYLYFRADGGIQVIEDPGGATPSYLGEVSPLGGTSDYAFTYDATDGSIYLFETDTNADGAFWQLTR